MQHLDAQQVRQNAARILEEVAREAARAGRDPAEIRVMAVTKTVDPQLVNEAIAAGIHLLGENKAQELCAKYDAYQKEGTEIHFIGHLQTNKVRQIVDKVSMIHSVDSLRLAQEIDRQCQKLDKVMPVLLEVNIGREESKGGVLPEQLEELLGQLTPLSHIQVRGLMAIPPVCEKPEEIDQYFSQMQQLFIDIKAKKLDNINMDCLSMGMSGDYLRAVRFGSNILRIGTALFGRRPAAQPQAAPDQNEHKGVSCHGL